MEVKIVLGHAFGDEGKGVTVQYLCKKAIDEGKKPLVIRFSGGPQAAHTVKYNGVTHVCSSYGSGVLLGVPTLILNSAYFDPVCAKNEYNVLKEKMEVVPPLYVSYDTNLITYYDVMSGRSDIKVITDGTCGKGIYPTFKRTQIDQIMSTAYDTLQAPETVIDGIKEYYGADAHPDLFKSFLGALNADFWNTVNDSIISFYDVWIFEGSQGLLLDMESGYYPNVTPSKVGLNGVPAHLLKDAELYLVERTYLTRHGNGYLPCKRTFNFNLENKFETNVYNEYQGKFKVGIYDFDLLHDAINRAHIDNYIKMYDLHPNLVITHFDLLDGVDEFHYKKNGMIDSFKFENKYFVANFINNTASILYEHVYVNESPESDLKDYNHLLENEN